MGRQARLTGSDNQVERRFGTTRHFSLAEGTPIDRPGQTIEAAELAFIRSLIHDLLAFAEAHGMPALQLDAEAAEKALELERRRTANLDVVH